MLTVVCVRWGTKYSAEYVIRLREGVREHLKVPHQFVCFTDQPEIPGIPCRQLPQDPPSWWSKLALFQPGILPGEKLYLDLDVVVTGDLGVFLKPEHPGRLWALDDFSYSLRVPKQDVDPVTARYLGGIGTCNSSIMYWQDDAASDVWTKFTPEVMERVHGDQNHITQVLWPHKLSLYPPGLACSYKYHATDRTGVGARAFGSVCVFHGDPKPDTLERDDPFRLVWEGVCAAS